MSKQSIPSWRAIAAEIIAATKADPESLRTIYDDREFRPTRNASVWAQLSARLAQARKAYREAVAKGCLKDVQHTMLRRCFAHDYTSPGSYMVTLVVPDRGSNPFGTVKGDIRQGRKGITLSPSEAAAYTHLSHTEGPLRLELTPLGASIQEALNGISTNYPMIEVRKAQLMPDHLHLILVAHASIISSNGKPRHLGHVIAGFKKGCNRRYWDLYSMGEPWNTATQAESAERNITATQAESAEQNITATQAESAERFSRSEKKVSSTASTGRPSLWAEGYTDTIILSNKHMTTEEAYLDDNIYRLRMKQLHRNLLRNVLHIRINGKEFAALGNIHLLRKPWKEQVQYHHWEQDVPAGYLPCDRSWHCQRFYYSAGEPQNTANVQNTAKAMNNTSAQNTTNVQNTANVQNNTIASTTAQVSGSSPARIFTLGSPIQGPTEADAHTERLLQAGDGGAVFISPFISETEKALRNAALTMGIPYIRLTREGFRDLYTPTKSEFEACCEGNLLILAPWEDRRRTATITRRECMELNHTAAMLSNEKLDLLWIRDNNDNDNNTIIPRDDE